MSVAWRLVRAVRQGIGAIGSILSGGLAIGFILSGLVTPAAAADDTNGRAMQFTWVPCTADCTGWIAASGFITESTLKAFEEFALGRDVRGASIALNSGGGSVNDAIALGRRWRALDVRTTVGKRVAGIAPGAPDQLSPDAYCELMCVLLLLAGRERYVPDNARVKVHQIWLGDRADNAKAHSYSAEDLTVVQRDIGRLVKYTADMGGSGELIRVMLSVSPWEKLHRLSADELRDGGIVTGASLAAVLPGVTILETQPVSVGVVDDEQSPLADPQQGQVTGATAVEARQF